MSSNATVGGTLEVTGKTTTHGIDNTGYGITTKDLTTTGNATVGGTLEVTGKTTTHGINNNFAGITNAGLISGVAAPISGTDAANKNYVDGLANTSFKGIAKVQAGVAISLALEAPSLTQYENFGLRLGWGNLDGDANAFGMSAMGVLCRGCMGPGTRLALDGGVGFSHSDYQGQRSESVVAGRGGIQLTWK